MSAPIPQVIRLADIEASTQFGPVRVSLTRDHEERSQSSTAHVIIHDRGNHRVLSALVRQGDAVTFNIETVPPRLTRWQHLKLAVSLQTS